MLPWSFQDQCLSHQQKSPTSISTSPAKWLCFPESARCSARQHARACNQVSLWKALIINSTSHPDNSLRKDQTSQDPSWEAPAHLTAQTHHRIQGSWQRKCCQLGSSCCPSYLFMPSNFKYSSWTERCQAGASCRASRGSPKYSINGKKTLKI